MSSNDLRRHDRPPFLQIDPPHPADVPFYLHERPYYPSLYPESVDYDYAPAGIGGNGLAPAGVIGGVGVALKALKATAALKGLKLLGIPLGLLGIAALSGIIPPTAIGGINLPFQGKRKKRSLPLSDARLRMPLKFEEHLYKKPFTIKRKTILR
ncbi:uncharacterized protein LOC129223693 [Uloborus diversus]|uniref:uncharacterized protein LOC129223693 n=1 Tax=Uloborus diversus TaxID=327109 RepID=UPI002409C31B|nr:uncharacterized protein LOC129223693 [Uloborus diversus]